MSNISQFESELASVISGAAFDYAIKSGSKKSVGEIAEICAKAAMDIAKRIEANTTAEGRSND